jgi:basic membrane protein A
VKKFRVLKKSIALLLSVGLMVSVVGCGQSSKQQSKGTQKLKVAFVYIGPINDNGYTQAQDQGRQYLVAKLGGKIETTYVENVAEVDCERVESDLAQKGNKVIFATSFGFMDPTINAAKKYPKVTFLHCSGYKTASNVGTYFGREYQARYLTGMVAGKMTKTNLIGYVAAFPIPEVVRGIDAFTLGVQSVNPNAKVKVVWTNTWLNPPSEKEAGKSLIEAGADVLAQHQDTPAVVQAAEEAGKYSTGYDSDMSKFAPKGYLTGPVWNWGPYFVKAVQQVLDGTWKTSQYWGPMGDKVIEISPYTANVPQDVRTLVDAKKQQLVAGTWDVFTGPIKDQTGQIRVANGQKLTDAQLLSFDWFVEGVEGTIPKSK